MSPKGTGCTTQERRSRRTMSQGKAGLADLIADSPPQTATPGTSQSGTDSGMIAKADTDCQGGHGPA